MRGILRREPRQPQTFCGALASSVLVVLLLSADSAAAQPGDASQSHPRLPVSRKCHW
jgi:hypothetical protein